MKPEFKTASTGSSITPIKYFAFPPIDAQDTFFISDPAKSTEFPPEYLEKVKKVHSQGGFGSQGYGTDWKIEEAQKNILRTHTTAVSARMLYKLGQSQEFVPQKYFSIGKKHA